MPDAAAARTILALAGDELLTPEQARAEANLKSRQTIYNWIHDERNPLPATKAGGWKIRRGDLARYMLERSDANAAAADGAATCAGLGQSDQALRAHLLKLIEIARAALEFRNANEVWDRTRDSCDLDFIEMGSMVLEARRDQLLATAGALDDETLTRLRFVVNSVTSSMTLRPEDAKAGGGPQ